MVATPGALKLVCGAHAHLHSYAYAAYLRMECAAYTTHVSHSESIKRQQDVAYLACAAFVADLAYETRLHAVLHCIAL